MKGSGEISPSSFGYKIGDRIITTSGGKTSNGFGLKLGLYFANVGDKGIITGVSGDKTEILYDNGQYGYRDEYSKEDYFNIIEYLNKEPTYEIY